MKLTKAHVTNFRSIEDSTEFTIDPHLTCFVGKNESGKTALLTALYRVNPIFPEQNARFDRTRDYPRRHLVDYEERHGNADAVAVVTEWEILPEEVRRVQEALGPSGLASRIVKVSTGYDNEQTWDVQINEAEVVGHVLGGSSLSPDERSNIGTVNSIAELHARLSSMGELPANLASLKQRLEATYPQNEVWRAVEQSVVLPKFLMFSQYMSMAGQISLEQLKEHQAQKKVESSEQVFLALCEMSGTTLEKVIAISQFEHMVARFEASSIKITDEIFKFWSQNRFLKVEFRMDPGKSGDPAPFQTGTVFRTRIKNTLHDVSVPFDDRSTGFVWFFSFLVLFSQLKKKYGRNLIVLLDEPGLSLHGKAQDDLLRYFRERLCPEHQVLFTTHSPFMVPRDNLLCSRTVEDVIVEEQGKPVQVFGTKVGDDVLSTDKETLFPLQGALGYEITQTLFVGTNTLLVEGPSDVLYLRAMSEELRRVGRTALDPRWTICPAGGVDKVGAFVSLFGGNKLHVAVLTDFATGQKKKIDELRRSELLRAGHVFTANTYAGMPEADVEDMLGGPLYAAIINATYSLPPVNAVSIPAGTRAVKHVEQHFSTLPPSVPGAFDHYAPAAHFVENRASIMAVAGDSAATLGRFERLFTELNALL